MLKKLINEGIIGKISGFFVDMMLITKLIKIIHGRGECQKKELRNGC